MSQPVFEFVGEADAALELLGPWQASPARPAPVSFDAGAPPAEEPPENASVWRVNLPDDPAAVRAALGQAREQVDAAKRNLAEVPARFDEFVKRAGTPAGESVSFAAPSEPVFESGSPEAGLYALMGEAEKAESTQVSFGIGEAASEAWENARAEFGKLMEQANREFLHFAWVETSQNGLLLARTTVGWSGDANSVWRPEITPEQAQAHEQSLSLALNTRLMRLRLFTTMAAGAAKLSALLTATPVGAVMALPMAWKYVQQVLAQVRQLQKP
ncbi:MAG: hypothetical protein AB1846_15765 [Chloroflexota bacterium]